MSHVWKRALVDPLKRQVPTVACCRGVTKHQSRANECNQIRCIYSRATNSRLLPSLSLSSLRQDKSTLVVGSIARHMVKDATRTTSRSPDLNSYTASGLRSLSTEGGGGSDADTISECAKSIEQIVGRQKNEMAPLEVSRLLSPSARAEVTEAARQVAASSRDGSTAASTSAAAAAATSSAQEVPKPTKRDLQLVMLNQAIPFVGFGLMDNAILILAGDAIDNYFGVMFGISTLCAAALGNIVSDVAGVGLGTVIEDYCAKMGIPQPNLSSAQRQLRSVRFSGQFGCAFGLVVGCLVGMFPLLFIDSEKVERAKHDARMDEIFRYMVTEAKELIGAEHTCLFLVVDSEDETSPAEFTKREERRDGGGYLYGKYVDGVSTDELSEPGHKHVPLGRGVVSRAALSGDVINVYDARAEVDYSYNSDILQSVPPERVRNMVCVPVHDAHGNVIAVIQAINKVAEGSIPSDEKRARKGRGFTSYDMRVLRALATRISISFEGMHEEGKVHLRDTIQILKEHGASTSDDYDGQHSYRKRRPLFPEPQL